jgi:phosphatidylinositol glycan class Q protein
MDPTTNYWIILFNPPNQNSLQYFSLKPLVLDLRSIEAQWDVNDPSIIKSMEEKLDSTFPAPVEFKGGQLQDCLEKINNVLPINEKTGPRTIARGYLLKSIDVAVTIVAPIMNVVLEYVQLLLQFVLVLLSMKFPILKLSLFQISNVAQQLHLRIEQILFWPCQYAEWYSTEAKLSPKAQAQYIGFFNTAWLIANDIIIGIAFKAVLIENKFFIADTINRVMEDYSCTKVESMITWLLNWPGGLKLNAELATFLSDLFLWMIFAWKEALGFIIPYLPSLIWLLATTGSIGITFQISAFSDMISFFTIHLQLFYIISARIYNWILKVLDSTFHLFRGKRRNPLRNRVDSALYDLDQLLLGTVIFTILVFLLPTIAVFYLFFTLVFNS